MTDHQLSTVRCVVVRGVLEVSFGEFDEGDIVRLEDAYGQMPAKDNAQR